MLCKVPMLLTTILLPLPVEQIQTWQIAEANLDGDVPLLAENDGLLLEGR